GGQVGSRRRRGGAAAPAGGRLVSCRLAGGRLGRGPLGGAPAGGAQLHPLGEGLVLRFALLQVGQHRGGDADGGVGAGQHADEQHQRQVLQLASAEEAG